jgi:nuclear transport factor 2 (NTF2) superfamily protein
VFNASSASSGEPSICARTIVPSTATASALKVRFAYEWHDDSGQWYRSYGNENWAFDPTGRMKQRFASINGLPIRESARLFRWPLGRRPDDHPGLTELGLRRQ